MSKEKGMVYLVGAGPGDPELLTLKGSRILSEAEVLVYDRLASPEFLLKTPETCIKLYVGKEPGHHSMKQEEINRLLVEWALKGKTVVRLKGGDPFVFGRGGEEILELEHHGIAYEVVCGVTSAIAAPAWAGIPVTHRGIGQSFHVITGHTAAKENADEDTLTDGFPEYAKLPGTLVFLMGLSNLELIVRRLMENGKSPETPAAVVTNGTLPSGRCVRAKLSGLLAAVREAGLKPPGIIVVGEVAAFHMEGANTRPLNGVSVAVTGTDGMYEKLSKRFLMAGASVFRAEISYVEPCHRKELLETIDRIGEFSWVVFTSRNGVKLFFDAMREKKTDFRTLAGIKFAVVGSGTGDFLETYGIYAEFKPEEYTAAALAEGLCRLVKPGEKVLIPRAVQGSRTLTETLAHAGREFLDLPIYDIRTEDLLYDSMESKRAFRTPDYITFASGSAVRGFFHCHGEEKKKMLEAGTCPVCIGKVTAGVLKEYGISRVLTAKDYTADGILEAILEDRKNGRVCLQR